MCGEPIPEEYRGEDSISCCGFDFCSFACIGRHVKLAQAFGKGEGPGSYAK